MNHLQYKKAALNYNLKLEDILWPQNWSSKENTTL